MTVETAKKMGQAAAQHLDTIADDTAEMASDLAGRAMTAVRSAGAAAETLYDHGTDARDYLMRLVAANPLPALLVAGAIGYAIASRIQRR